MTLFILSFIAGVLTVAAPCILPLLPVIVGGSLVEGKYKEDKSWLRPLIIALSLAVSVVVFTLLLKATTVLLGVPQVFWYVVSGTIVLLFGLNLVVPSLWEKLMVLSGLNAKTNILLNETYKRKGLPRDIALGAALGPVFSSCSPTYALIVAAILPQSFAKGLIYLIAYALGLAAVLLLLAWAGQGAARKLGWLSNPHGWFKRSLGLVLIVVGVAVIFGLDKKFQAFVLDRGWYDGVRGLEMRLRR